MRWALAWESLVIVVLSLLALLTVGPLLVARLGLLGILVSEVLLVAGPAILWLGFRAVPRSEVGVAPTQVKLHAILGGALAGLGAFYLMALVETHLFDRVLPVPPEIKRSLKELIVPGAGLRPLLQDLLALAVAPALCEELLFRGGVLHAWRRPKDRVTAIVVAAVLFGAFHASPYRVLPATTLGLVLGVVRVASGSLFPAIAFHLVNNLAVIFVVRAGYDTPPVGVGWLVGAGAALVLGFALVRLRSQPS